MKPTTWKNCYSQQWAGILIPAAFAHPAKISLALVKKIFTHALENNWIQKGDTCVDPFAGIGGVAFGAMSAGLKFVGQELEPHFVELANGMECTPEKLCPTCKARAEQPASKNETFFDEPTGNHHFEGNIEFWKRKFGLSGAVILQGDSRRLLENLRDKVECVVSSPPFSQSSHVNNTMMGEQPGKAEWRGGTDSAGRAKRNYHEPQGKNNLGNLPAGNFDAVISSPPYVGNEKSDYQLSSDGKMRRRDEKRGYRQGTGCFRGSETYGQTEGQLGTMRDKDFDLVVSSPPYASSVHSGNGIDPDKLTGNKAGKNSQAFSQGYGDSPAQLGSMPEGRFDIAVSSPPFEACLGSGGKNHSGVIPPHDTTGFVFTDYINSAGNIGVYTRETFWSAARDIVQQCFLALKPGGYAIWVCKNFVRKGQVVEFSQQWARLCEAVGFELVCWHQASLVEVGASQLNVHGEDTVKIKSRKSFFRRLAEKNGSPEINHEDAICFVKPTKTFERLYLDGRNGKSELKTERVTLRCRQAN